MARNPKLSAPRELLLVGVYETHPGPGKDVTVNIQNRNDVKVKRIKQFFSFDVFFQKLGK